MGFETGGLRRVAGSAYDVNGPVMRVYMLGNDFDNENEPLATVDYLDWRNIKVTLPPYRVNPNVAIDPDYADPTSLEWGGDYGDRYPPVSGFDESRSDHQYRGRTLRLYLETGANNPIQVGAIGSERVDAVITGMLVGMWSNANVPSDNSVPTHSDELQGAVSLVRFSSPIIMRGGGGETNLREAIGQYFFEIYVGADMKLNIGEYSQNINNRFGLRNVIDIYSHGGIVANSAADFTYPSYTGFSFDVAGNIAGSGFGGIDGVASDTEPQPDPPDPTFGDQVLFSPSNTRIILGPVEENPPGSGIKFPPDIFDNLTHMVFVDTGGNTTPRFAFYHAIFMYRYK